MKLRIKKISCLIIYFLLLLAIVFVITFINNDIVLNSNIRNYTEKIYKKPMNVKEENEFLYKGKVYKIILSTAEDKNDELYLQCFRKILGGLFYYPTRGSSQGSCKSLYGMTIHSINNTNDSFIIVYGYNKELKANSYSVERESSGKWITEDISKEEYFLDTYTDIDYAKIVFKDACNNDISEMFHGQ